MASGLQHLSELSQSGLQNADSYAHVIDEMYRASSHILVGVGESHRALHASQNQYPLTGGHEASFFQTPYSTQASQGMFDGTSTAFVPFKMGAYYVQGEGSTPYGGQQMHQVPYFSQMDASTPMVHSKFFGRHIFHRWMHLLPMVPSRCLVDIFFTVGGIFHP